MAKDQGEGRVLNNSHSVSMMLTASRLELGTDMPKKDDKRYLNHQSFVLLAEALPAHSSEVAMSRRGRQGLTSEIVNSAYCMKNWALLSFSVLQNSTMVFNE